MCGVYLHECNKQEEGVGSPPDLLIQKPGEKGEHPILGGTAGEDNERTLCVYIQKDGGRDKEALAEVGIRAYIVC